MFEIVSANFRAQLQLLENEANYLAQFNKMDDANKVRQRMRELESGNRQAELRFRHLPELDGAVAASREFSHGRLVRGTEIGNREVC